MLSHTTTHLIGFRKGGGKDYIFNSILNGYKAGRTNEIRDQTGYQWTS